MIKLVRLLLALVGVIVIVMLAVDNRGIVEALWLSSQSKRREARQLRRKVAAVEYQDRLAREREEQAALEQARRKTQSLALASPHV
jgi:hypothetical protein